MKKFYFTLGAVLLSSLTLFAQKSYVNLGHLDMTQFEMGLRTPTDTLSPGDFVNGTPSLYGSNGGGYVVGNNAYGDLAKGQIFLNNATIVEGALFWFGAKEDGGNSSDVVAELRSMDGIGASSTDSADIGPGTLLASVNMPLSGVDTSGNFTVATFASPTAATGDFYAGFDVSGFSAGDTLGLVSTADGDGGAAELNWEKWSDDTWHTMIEAWPLDFDFGIWVVVDNSASGIESEDYVNGIKADCYPNPALDVANIVFDLQNSANVQLQIVDITGKLVYSIAGERLSQGRHTFNIPVTGFGAGTYYYSLNADGRRFTKKMIVK